MVNDQMVNEKNVLRGVFFVPLSSFIEGLRCPVLAISMSAFPPSGLTRGLFPRALHQPVLCP